MKYLKLFENKTLDDILDKINLTGMDSLTELEKDFLNRFSKGNHKDVEKKIEDKKKVYRGISAYDPREDDTDFYKEIGKQFGIDDMNFDDWSDEEILDGKYLQLWDQLYDEDMDNFLLRYKLPDNYKEYPWDKLPEKTKEFFKKYLKDVGII
jgi:hypothetical protein